ncbi:MAG: hypothetical protein HYT75_02460 [Deltaproteobacteria bacterium]|nr:hypothetical protein [Deltaproteobacteria bacterium]MBI2341599.1 hypothetical protein [Deltaproteobacteria bacterium]
MPDGSHKIGPALQLGTGEDLFHGPLVAFGFTNTPPRYMTGNDIRGYEYQ